MIISRTPLRISFFGGGTDFPDWYNNNRGKVISTTINKYSYVTARYLPPFFDFKYRLRYFLKEEVKRISLIKHPSIRETLKYLKINKNLEIIHNADLPAQSGLGASSCFTVGLINCLIKLSKKNITKEELYLKAIEIEQNRIKEFVGSQDQTICSIGGSNIINFSKKIITTKKLPENNDNLKKLEKSIFLIFTGFTREAQKIEKNKIKNIKKNYKFYEKILEITDEAEAQIYNSSNIVLDYAELMNKYWWYKKKLSDDVTQNKIDKIFNFALNKGAYSGKLLGAGGGGFLMLLIDPQKKKYFSDIFKNYTTVPIKFEQNGSQIIYHQKQN